MRLALVTVFVLFAASASAQTVESVIDLNALGWGPIAAPIAVETDGDLATREWLIRRPFSTQTRVVAERDGKTCAGPWFSPVASAAEPLTIQRIGLVHKVVTQRSDGMVAIIALDTPVCE